MKHFTIILIASLFSFYTLKAQSESVESDSLIHLAIQKKVDKIFDSLISVRRDFHRYPELSGQEERTSKKIAQYLSSLGLEVKTNIGGFGVVGILKGAKEGKKIAWRADIDAMPSEASDAVDFESKNIGVRHICGHDIHTTVALGIANVLASQREFLSGTVYFVFQPSEENLQGAQAMIDDGLFKLIKPDEMYALHITPFPSGTVAVKSEELFADYKKLSVTLKSTEKSDEIIDFAKKQIRNLQNVEPESKFWDMMSMGDPEIGIAGQNSIYKNYTLVSENIDFEEANGKLILTAYISTSEQEQRDLVLPYLNERFKQSEFADGLLDIRFVSETPTILNNDQLTNENLATLSTLFGNERVIPLTGVVADGRSDDFALFQQKVPTVYFFLGGSNYETGTISQPHSPDFIVDESSIKTGVQFFSSMIAGRLLDE